jgi:hypothetical protein
VRTEEDLNTAVANAIDFFKESREPHALLWLVVMHRRFGIKEFADALQRYDRVLNEQPEQAPLRRVLRRFADRDNPLQPDDWDAVTLQSDRIMVCALYCDRLGLPPSFAEMLHKAASAGGYYLPHVILAWFWIQENGCGLVLPEGFMDRVYGASAAIINDEPTIVSDLRLEVAAFLHLVGQGARVDAVWGHARGKQGSDWHSTVLGLLLLLQLKFPAASGTAATA